MSILSLPRHPLSLSHSVKYSKQTRLKVYLSFEYLHERPWCTKIPYLIILILNVGILWAAENTTTIGLLSPPV